MVNTQTTRRDKGERGGFDYRPTNPKKLKERAERTGGGFDTYFKPGINIYKNKVGENCVRICPPTFKDHEHFGLEIWVHGWVGPDKASFLCPKKMKGKKCCVCDSAAEALDAGEKEEGDDLKPKQKVIYWVIDRDGDSDDPEVWPVSWTMDKDISGRCEKRSGKILELDNPWNGHDVTFRRTGQGLKTRYTGIDVDSEKTPLADTKKGIQRLLDFLQEHPLDEILKYHTNDQMQAALEGGAAEKDEDLDEDEGDEKRGKRRRGRDDEDEEDGRKSRSTRARSGDDEDEEEEPSGKRRARRSSEDDDEEGETSRRRRGRDDDGDEDDGGKKKRKRPSDEDEDEDEDQPKRRRRSRDEDEVDPADEDEDEDEDGDDDRRTSKAKKTKRKPVADADEEDEEEPRAKRRNRAKDDDDERDDAPRSKKRKSRDDDGDEDEEEEEVEEDDPPSSRRAKRK